LPWFGKLLRRMILPRGREFCDSVESGELLFVAMPVSGSFNVCEAPTLEADSAHEFAGPKIEQHFSDGQFLLVATVTSAGRRTM
jgi:hypothetical protein